MTIAIYTRVSTNKQDSRSQDLDLNAWATSQEAKGEVIKWYRDKSTGTNFERPGWKKLEADLATGKVSKLVVWRLDRLGRTAGETIRLLDSLEPAGVGFLSLRDAFDSSTPTGKLMRNVLCSVAQFETEVRRERQMAGIAAAKEQGRYWGGRKVGTRITLTQEKEALCRKLKDEGTPVAEIARNLGIARKTVYVALNRKAETSNVA